jgi:tetraacyldisaccharide 4'-kinase
MAIFPILISHTFFILMHSMKKRFHIKDLLFFPLSLVYGFVVWLRNRLFDFKIFKSKEFNIPIISVGNITVGGTGKTPHIEYLIRLMQLEGFRPAVLSRGYKRKSSGFVLSTSHSSSDEVGDEPRQMKQKHPEIPVAVDGNRVRGISKLIELEKELSVILLDDAFQHRYVTPGLSILLIDFNNPLHTDAILPYGRLRESAAERSRADMIIISKCSGIIKPIDKRLIELELKLSAYQKLFFTSIVYDEPLPVFPGFASGITLNEISLSKPLIFLLTGIADNQPLKIFLQQLTDTIESLYYPDHYSYTAKDLYYIIERFSQHPAKNKIIITTEKDAMRLQQYDALDEEIKAVMYYVPIRIEFLENEDKNFNHYITSYVRNNKPDNILHKPIHKEQS